MSTQLNFMSDTVVTMCLTGYQGRSSALADAHVYKNERVCVYVCVCVSVCLSLLCSLCTVTVLSGSARNVTCGIRIGLPYRWSEGVEPSAAEFRRRRQPKLTSAAVYCAANHLHLFNQSFLSRENLQTVNHMLTEDRFCHITLILRSLY